MKLGGSDGCQGGGRDEFIAFSSDVHGCCNFCMMPVYVLFGDTSAYDTPMMPPWRNIGRIRIGLTLEKNIGIQSGGVHQLQTSFFSIWHIAGDGRLAMDGASLKVGVHLKLYFKVDSM
jgi:hypothetical protein